MPSTITVHTADAEHVIIVPTVDELSTVDTNSDFAKATGNGSDAAGLYARQDGGWERINDPAEIDHDNLTNYVAAEHVAEGDIDHDAIDQTTVNETDHRDDTSVRSAVNGATISPTQVDVGNIISLPPQDVRNISSPQQGYVGYHNGDGTDNTEGPAFYDGTQWWSLVDSTKIN